MCLTIKKESQPLIAEKDIICYKSVHISKDIDVSALTEGDSFTAIIRGNEITGKISIEQPSPISKKRVFFCSDSPIANGSRAANMHGYLYSWVFDPAVSSVIVDNVERIILVKMKTPYHQMEVKIGEEYTSPLRRITKGGSYKHDTIEEGLHSTETIQAAKEHGQNIVECIIPKGATYYIGTNSGRIGYASDRIKYIKLVK